MVSTDAWKRRRFAGLVVCGPLAVLLAGCANHLGTTSASFLKHAREDTDPNRRHLAYAKLANLECYDDPTQMVEAATFLASRLDEKREPVVTRAVICRTLGELRRPEALDSLRRCCDDPHAIVRAAACRAIGKIGAPEDTAILARIMAADIDADCRIAAIEGMGLLGSVDPRATEVLISGMESDDPAIRLASYESLQRITGRNPGPEPEKWKAMMASGAPANSGSAPETQ
jgi:HEAT repeat protein